MRAIKRKGNGFALEENGELAGEITFRPIGNDVIDVDHTYVSPALRGQNLARDLVQTVVDYARQNNLKIIPSCTYVDAQFRRNKEYQDVWMREG